MLGKRPNSQSRVQPILVQDTRLVLLTFELGAKVEPLEVSISTELSSVTASKSSCSTKLIIGPPDDIPKPQSRKRSTLVLGKADEHSDSVALNDLTPLPSTS